MKYSIISTGALIIYNDLGLRIFMMNNNTDWIKRDYDHNGKKVFFGNSDGVETYEIRW